LKSDEKGRMQMNKTVKINFKNQQLLHTKKKSKKKEVVMNFV